MGAVEGYMGRGAKNTLPMVACLDSEIEHSASQQILRPMTREQIIDKAVRKTFQRISRYRNVGEMLQCLGCGSRKVGAHYAWCAGPRMTVNGALCQAIRREFRKENDC